MLSVTPAHGPIHRVSLLLVVILLCLFGILLQCGPAEHWTNGDFYSAQCSASLPDGNIRDHWGRGRVEATMGSEAYQRVLSHNKTRPMGSLVIAIGFTFSMFGWVLWILFCSQQGTQSQPQKESKEEV